MEFVDKECLATLYLVEIQIRRKIRDQTTRNKSCGQNFV